MIQSISERLGVTMGAFYRHFSSVLHLRADVLSAMLIRCITSLRRAPAGRVQDLYVEFKRLNGLADRAQ